MKLIKKPVEVEAFTFDEFVEIGRKWCQDNPIEGNLDVATNMPWYFKFNGYGITHENDECYVIPTLEGNHYFTPKDILIVGVKGEIYPCKLEIARMTYDFSENNEREYFGWCESCEKPLALDDEYGSDQENAVYVCAKCIEDEQITEVEFEEGEEV